MNKVRVRYAPSPTGYLHIGGARTALFNYLFAKHHHGQFILRIEDTDIERNVEKGEDSQIDNLEWLGVIADESPRNPNPQYGPYRQMERLEIYAQAAHKLIEMGHAYKCFCTSEELEEDYTKQSEAGISATRYNRKCLGLTSQQISEYEKQGKPYSIRLKVPSNQIIKFHDLIRGEVSFNSKDFGDFVILKNNGIPTYNFAVVLDDHLMDITHVFRGEEHLSNTPKQLIIYDLLGFTPPQFGHMTLIVNEQHKKLSKRDTSLIQFIEQYKNEGYLAPAITNFLALLGWSPLGNEEILSLEQLIEMFDETRLSKAPSMFDQNKLNWINSCYLKKLSDEELYNFCLPFLSHFDLSKYTPDQLLNLLKANELSYGSQIASLLLPFFVRPTIKENDIINTESAQKVFKTFLSQIDCFEQIKDVIKATQTISGVKGKDLYMPLRIALTGLMHGVDFSTIIATLGKEEVKTRISLVVNDVQ